MPALAIQHIHFFLARRPKRLAAEATRGMSKSKDLRGTDSAAILLETKGSLAAPRFCGDIAAFACGRGEQS